MTALLQAKVFAIMRMITDLLWFEHLYNHFPLFAFASLNTTTGAVLWGSGH